MRLEWKNLISLANGWHSSSSDVFPPWFGRNPSQRKEKTDEDLLLCPQFRHSSLFVRWSRHFPPAFLAFAAQTCCFPCRKSSCLMNLKKWKSIRTCHVYSTKVVGAGKDGHIWTLSHLQASQASAGTVALIYSGFADVCSVHSCMVQVRVSQHVTVKESYSRCQFLWFYNVLIYVYICFIYIVLGFICRKITKKITLQRVFLRNYIVNGYICIYIEDVNSVDDIMDRLVVIYFCCLLSWIHSPRPEEHMQ